MADTEVVLSSNVTSLTEVSSLMEDLHKAFVVVEAHTSTGNVQWNDVQSHFRNLESMMKKKLEELDAKEKDYAEREKSNRMLLAEKEAAVVTKELDMLDKVQELKDAAVAAIAEAVVLSNPVSQVRGSADVENTLLDVREQRSPQTTEESIEDVKHLCQELTQFCEQMDAKGLLNFVIENPRYSSATVRDQLSVALVSATFPTRLVLDALTGISPPKQLAQQGESQDAASHGMHKSCLVLLEALSAFLSKAGFAADIYLTPEIKQQAKAIAEEWKPILADATNENSLEAEGFLRLLATFRIASEYDNNELCKYVLAVAHHRQATALCRSLELSEKIPGIVETLISRGKQIDAVHFIQAFQLSEVFPPVFLLKTYLKELRRKSQSNGSAAARKDCNAREHVALKSVVECVEEYGLEADYPLDPLRIRLAQLEKRRTEDGVAVWRLEKKPRTDGGFQKSRGRGSGFVKRSPSTSRERLPYPVHQQRYASTVPSTYPYPVPGQSVYNHAQASDHRLYYHPQESRARELYPAATPGYASYLQPSHNPYM